MIVDVKCTNPDCGKVQEDALVKSEADLPPCACGAPTERLWTLTRHGSNRSANEASVGFRFNYPEP